MPSQCYGHPTYHFYPHKITCAYLYESFYVLSPQTFAIHCATTEVSYWYDIFTHIYLRYASISVWYRWIYLDVCDTLRDDWAYLFDTDAAHPLCLALRLWALCSSSLTSHPSLPKCCYSLQKCLLLSPSPLTPCRATSRSSTSKKPTGQYSRYASRSLSKRRSCGIISMGLTLNLSARLLHPLVDPLLWPLLIPMSLPNGRKARS